MRASLVAQPIVVVRKLRGSAETRMPKPQSLTFANFTNAILIATCCVVMYSAWQRAYRPSAPGAPIQGYQAGDVAPEIDGVRYQVRPRTVILALSSTCRYCAEDAPFYKALAKARDQRNFQLVVVGTEQSTTLAEYLRGLEITSDHLASVAPGTLRVSGTPAIILVDSGGRVTSQWVGALRGRESQVDAAIGS